MDARIAIITGTVFAGVLVAGALAAPRGGGNATAEGDSTLATTAFAEAPSTVSTATLPQSVTVSRRDGSDTYEDDSDTYQDDDSDAYEDDRHDDDDDRDSNRGRDHEEDDD